MPIKDPERKKAVQKAWRECNRERHAALNKAYRERHPERVAATKKAYRERNPERVAAKGKAWYERNREKELVRRKARYERNLEQERQRRKVYRERYPEKIAEMCRRRRCRERNASIRLTANETQKILILERTRLELQKETGGEYHIDHILPIVHGGIHHPMNLRILEGRENESKQAKLLPEAIDLAYEHFMLYHDRVSPERAWEFVHQLAEGLDVSVDEIRIDDQQIKLSLPTKSTLEDLME
jgi:hypothetical protein